MSILLVQSSFTFHHAVANGNWRIQIREQTLEFCSTGLPAPSPYLQT